MNIRDLSAHRSKPAKRPIKRLTVLTTVQELSNRDFKLFNEFGDKDKAKMFLEFSTLLSAGVDLQSILQLLQDTRPDKDKAKGIYRTIAERIIKGDSFSEAMRYTGVFNNFDCYSVLVGETTGELGSVFDRLGVYYNKRVARKRKLYSALSYPLIVVLTTIGTIYFMMKFVVPMFSETIMRFGGELPPLTLFIIRLSNNISLCFGIAFCIAVSAFLLYRRYKHTDQVQEFIAVILLKMPYFGKIIYRSHLVQFTHTMSLLLTSKVNIVDSITLTNKIATFYPLKKALTNIENDLLKGEYFYVSLQKQRFFDVSLITLVRIGEEVNQLDKMFIQLSKQYEDELEYNSSILVSALEPIMILVLALLVGIILVAMYLPMFKMGTVIH